MKTEVAKYKVLLNTDCDICRGYYDLVYEFVYSIKKPGDNVVTLERCRFCPECLDNVTREFGDDIGSI